MKLGTEPPRGGELISTYKKKIIVRIIRISFIVFIIGAAYMLVSAFAANKKKKFLDYFINYKLDTLYISSPDYNSLYENKNVPLSVKGTPIDSSFFMVFKTEGVEEIIEYSTFMDETGPMAYYKIKLDDGYYLLIIRWGGAYYNSRVYGCLYNSGDRHITSVLLLSDELGDAGYYFVRTSNLKQMDKHWDIYSHEYYSEPMDYEKYEMDSIQIREIDFVTSIEKKDEHYFFLETSRIDTKYKSK